MKYEITKGSEKDFEGAPEWATLRTFTGGRYFFAEEHRVGARVFDISSKDEFKVEDSFDEERIDIIAERRPITEPVWDGEGLPPVGTKCEVQTSSNSPWFECEIVYSGESGAAFISTKSNSIGCVDDSCTDFFRPIRSPEDVARDEAIDSMAEIIEYRTGCSPKPLARWLYEAGYRKME